MSGINAFISNDELDGENVQFGVMIVIYGDSDSPFTDMEKQTYMIRLKEFVENELLLPGQLGHIWTLNIT